jgi:excinuclease ABC subunit C
MLTSRLDSIEGIGEKRRKALLKHFGSLKKIKEASLEQLKMAGLGEKIAQSLMLALRDNAGEETE